MTTTAPLPPPPPLPSTTPPPPPPTTGRTPAQAVAAAVDALRVATIAFNTPTHLGRDETETIQLLLSPDTIFVPQLEKRLTEAGEQSGEPVHYSRLMEAILTSNDFEISANQDLDPQSVAAGRDTEWSWDIRPKRTGKLRLALTLYAFVDVAGERDKYKVQTFKRILTINVTWPMRLADFVKGNWQWLWTAILVPVDLWFVRRRSQQAAADAKPSRHGTST